MKKLFLFLFCVFAIANAYGFKSGDLYYNITSTRDMTVEVTYNSSDQYSASTYIIPDYVTYEGNRYYVDRIGNSAFAGDNFLTSIRIPKNIKSIGNYAFSGCFSLYSVVIDDAPTTLSLGSGARNGNSLFADASLTTFYWGRPLSYNTNSNNGYSPIANQPALSNITIGPNIITITAYMFYGNKSITSIELPTTVTSLGDHAFHGFQGLTSFSIPDHITSVGEYAFAGCTGLTSFTIPEHITSIADGTFSGCTGFTSFVIPKNVMSVGNYAFQDCEKLASVVVKPSVTSIGNGAFNGCAALTGVVFEESEETLKLGYNEYNSSGTGKGMFYDCPLQSAFIGRPLNYSYGTYYSDYPRRYGYSPFANNTTLTKAHFGNPVKAIQLYLFAGCTALKTLQYNSNCKPTNIEKYAFWTCKSLTETDIVYPESVNTIGEGAFKYCTSLEGYTIPNHITTVGAYAFQDCEKLAFVVVKPSVTSIGNYAFNGCTSLTGVVFEESEETLKLGYNEYNSSDTGKGMFYDCPLQSAFIGRPLNYSYGTYYSDYPRRYGYSPFANNTTLTKVHFGNPVKAIQLYLFAGCTALKTLQYNSNCKPTNIEKYAFWTCKSLTESDIVYPESVNTIGEGAFKYCTSLEGYTIPNHITTVGAYAFQDCEKLASVVVKPSVTSIGNYAFNGCTSLTGVVFEESEEPLKLGYNEYNSSGTGKGMFYDCPLQSAFIGRPLNYSYGTYYSDYPHRYGYSPFANNTTLTMAHVGNPVTRIPNYLFLDNTKLSNVIFNENCQLQSVGKYAFDGCKILPTPQFPNTVTAFEEGAFRNCASFTDFDLPENLLTIGSYTFQNCAALTKLTIPATTTSIGNYAYAGCTGITSIVMKDAEETLSLGYGADKGKGYGLFYDCPLEELYLGKTLSYVVKSDGSYGYSPFYKKETLSKVTVGTKVSSLPYCVFFGTAIEELYVPSSVRTVHSSFVNGCANLKKVIILGATPPSTDTSNTMLANSAENSKFYVFFPDLYKSTKIWKNYADKIDACCEIYSNFTYSGDGHVIGYKTDFPIVLDNRETDAIDAGTYLKRIDVTYQTNGYTMKDLLDYEYVIQKAPLTITAKSCSRSFGASNPEFEFKYEGFVNDEDEKVLTKEPTATTKANVNSPVGEYEIVVSGAEAKNYEISYVNGILTITDVTVIPCDVNSDGIVDTQDVLEIYKYMQQSDGSTVPGKYDVNGDGIVDTQDVLEIYKYIQEH